MSNTTLDRTDLSRGLGDLLGRARTASRALARADRDGALLVLAEGLLERQTDILAANAEDVAAERAKGTSDALLDRLTLSATRLQEIADAVRQVAALPDPLHRVLADWTLPNGLGVRKVSVPFGVIGMVYESRPERHRRRGGAGPESRERRRFARVGERPAEQPGARRRDA